jgi:hypothetical protein
MPNIRTPLLLGLLTLLLLPLLLNQNCCKLQPCPFTDQPPKQPIHAARACYKPSSQQY